MLGAATQKASPSSSAFGESGSSMYGNFGTGDFSVGGFSMNSVIVVVALALVAVFFLKK